MNCEGSKQQLSTLSSIASPKPSLSTNPLIYLKWLVPRVPVQPIRLQPCLVGEEDGVAEAPEVEVVAEAATKTPMDQT